MKRLIFLIASSLLFLSACSGEKEETTANSGEALYEKSCASCHGGDLKGAASPPVTNMAEKYTEEEMISPIQNGKGMMPGNLLTEEETDIVAKWLLEQ